jgi:hypothetical protein
MLQFEQRANTKFMCKLEKSASETLSALQQVYGDTALKKSAVCYLFSRFKNGEETLEETFDIQNRRNDWKSATNDSM